MEIPAGLVQDTAEHTIETLSKCFCNDAFQRYLVFDDLGIPDSETLDVSLNRQEFQNAVHGLVSEGAILVTVPGSGIASVWHLDEGNEEDLAHNEHLPRVINEMNSAADKARKRMLAPHRKYMRLALIGNDKASVPGEGRKSTVGDVIRPMLEMATSHGWPVVLEATSPHSREIYAHLGFKVADEIVVGKGRIDGSAHRVEGGSGVSLWVMVYGS